jgi:ribonuclease HI
MLYSASILLYSALFYPALFCSILLYSILHYSALFCSILLYYDSNVFGGTITGAGKHLFDIHGKMFTDFDHISSQRAETYAMLAGITSLEFVMKFCDSTPSNNTKIVIYSDCKFLLKRTNDRLQYNRTVNQFIFPDFDLENELIQCIQALQSKFTVQLAYIQGHPDKKKSAEQLTPEDQMIIQADNLCLQARQLRDVTTYHTIPSNTVNFYMNGRILNHRIANATKRAYRSMPTNKCHHRFYAFMDNICHSCKQTIENEDHILQCISFT